MQIIMKNGRRILLKEQNNEYDNEINIDDGDIIQYQGIYYKEIQTHAHIEQIQTMFVGKVCQYRSDTTGFTGIYVEPLYIYDAVHNQWKKIMNYEKPNTYYFSYPHLLMLPEKEYRHLPLYFLHTCSNVELHDFYHFTEEFYL